MTWFNQQVFSLKEVEREMPKVVFPSRFQLHDKVKVWLDQEDGSPHQPLDAVILGVNFVQGYVLYDLGVRIGDSDYYAVINQSHGAVTPPHFIELPKEYESIEITKEMEVGLRRGMMQVVETAADTKAPTYEDRMQLAEAKLFPRTEESVTGRPGLKLVPLNLPSLELEETTAPD